MSSKNSSSGVAWAYEFTGDEFSCRHKQQPTRHVVACAIHKTQNEHDGSTAYVWLSLLLFIAACIQAHGIHVHSPAFFYLHAETSVAVMHDRRNGAAPGYRTRSPHQRSSQPRRPTPHAFGPPAVAPHAESNFNHNLLKSLLAGHTACMRLASS